MLIPNTAPPARATPAAGAPADPATTGGIDFTDMLTKLMAPSGQGQPVEVKHRLKQGIVPAPGTGVGPALVVDAALSLSVATVVAGDAPLAPRVAGSATTSDGKAGDDQKDPLPVPVAVIDVILAPLQPVLQPLTAAAPTAPEGVRPQHVPVTGPIALAVPLVPIRGIEDTGAAATAVPAADSYEAAAAAAADMPPGVTTDGPASRPAPRTIPAAANLEILLDLPAPVTASPAEGVTIPRPSMGKPAASASAIAALALTGAHPAQPAADASPVVLEASFVDQEGSRGDAKNGGGHGQTLQSAPAPAAAHDAPTTPITASTAPMAGVPGIGAGQGLTAAPLYPADAAALAPQIVQAIKIQWQGGIGEARIKLNPEYLGELTIAIRVERGGMVSASLESGSSSVRQWLQGNESSLRQGLAEQGLHLDRLQVSEQSPRVTWDGEKPREHEQPSPHRKQSPQRRRPDEPTFEVVV